MPVRCPPPTTHPVVATVLLPPCSLRPFSCAYDRLFGFGLIENTGGDRGKYRTGRRRKGQKAPRSLSKRLCPPLPHPRSCPPHPPLCPFPVSPVAVAAFAHATAPPRRRTHTTFVPASSLYFAVVFSAKGARPTKHPLLLPRLRPSHVCLCPSVHPSLSSKNGSSSLHSFLPLLHTRGRKRAAAALGATDRLYTRARPPPPLGVPSDRPA